MRIIPFPQPAGAPGEPTPAEIETALHGDAVGEPAEQWRDLRADVRALAPPLPPGLEQRLYERIEERAEAQHGARSALTRLNALLGASRGRRAAALAGALLVVVVLAVAVALPWRSGSPGLGAAHPHAGVAAIGGSSSSAVARPRAADERGTARSSQAAVAGQAAPTEASTRVQQRAASLTLASKPAEIQSLCDRVAQLAVREGGYVQSSQVHVESTNAGEASLRLSLPSARLSAALASLARLAPARSESQSLQDITDEYGAARRKLSDAVAERQALLRALARANTQGQIESLHARLSLASGAITSAREAFQSIASRGSNATVEVTVAGDTHAGGDGGLSVSRGLHDAGVVLRVSLAVLVPLAIIAALLALGWRASRRRLRERALS